LSDAVPAPDPTPGPRTAPDPEAGSASAAGGEPRFAQLYEETAPALYAWASLRIRPALRPRLDPEDLLQEVWVRALEAEGRRRAAGADFRPWVFGMAKNVLLEAFRKAEAPRASGALGTSTRLALIEELPDQATAITRRVARDETLRRFLERARALSDEDRMILLHHGFEGLSHSEVATRLGLSRDTVAKRWQRLRGRLLDDPALLGLLAAQ
jgi:RNA polymerase sigma-70 factor (ECF subfamily)